MTLEEYIAHLNGLAFWKEFTFARTRFTPQPGQELELTDNLVWLGNHAYVLQLKERSEESADPAVERLWFRRKVLGKATRQVRDTLRFLKAHEHIRIVNERGHSFDIQSRAIAETTKIVIFLGGMALPDDCLRMRYHISQSAGFIHLVAANDYLGILEKLRVPEDIRRYFVYREDVAPKLAMSKATVEEADIMGAFLCEETIPTPKSREHLSRFVQDLPTFDLSPIIGNLHDHISKAEQPQDYYRIMLEFARVPRSVWREVKVRLAKSVEAVRENEFTRPFRLAFPATDCAFMIAPLDPQLPTTGFEGEKVRARGLQNLTFAAMYDTKVSRGVGILISKDKEHIQIDWCLLDLPWERDPEMDARLAHSNPFREAKARMIDSFRFRASPGNS
jgi:hypothetical protein